MGRVLPRVYRPIPGNKARYQTLYEQYCVLHDAFGRGGNDVMKRIKRLREEVLREPNEREDG